MHTRDDGRSAHGRDPDRSRSIYAICIAAAVALALLSAGGAGIAAGQDDTPDLPAAYYGDVTVNGDPAPEGTEITAEIDGEARGSIEVTTAGEYGGPDAFDEKLEVEGESGDEVTFVVDGVEAEETVTWESGDVREVGLTFEGVPDGGDSDGGDGGDDSGSSGGGGGGSATDGEEEEATSGGGGGGGGGGVAPADETETDGEPAEPDVEVLHEESTEIDAEAETPQAEFSEESTVERLEFETDSESVSGSASVQELDSEPDDTGDSPGEAVAVSEISVPEEVEDQPATVRMSVATERLASMDADPSELRINRFSDGEWQQLETEVVEQTDAELIVAAQTPGFSYFALSAVSEPSAAIAIGADSPSAGEDITLDATGSENEHGEIASYEWAVDGDSFDGETATVAFSEAGEYEIELTIENDAGETDTVTRTVTVESDSESSGSGSNTADGASDSDSEPIDEPAELPGFGAGIALVALLAAAFVAVRRADED
jgi:PGF-pre-PGF domain-containing protein/PGF-CTERM protein